MHIVFATVLAVGSFGLTPMDNAERFNSTQSRNFLYQYHATLGLGLPTEFD